MHAPFSRHRAPNQTPCTVVWNGISFVSVTRLLYGLKNCNAATSEANHHHPFISRITKHWEFEAADDPILTKAETFPGDLHVWRRPSFSDTAPALEDALGADYAGRELSQRSRRRWVAHKWTSQAAGSASRTVS